MKKTALYLLLLQTGTLFSFSGIEALHQSPTVVEVFTADKNDNILELPVNFAKEIILNPEEKKLLKEKAIHQIDLVYTRFKSSPNFNQVTLNEKRMEELKNLLPKLKNNKSITWNLIEQKGADNREDAAKLFHGFVIHFGKKVDYTTLNQSFKELQKDFKNYTIQAEQGGSITYESGTKVTFSPNSITYADGSPVKGKVEINYREFRNPAEILFSGIPMTYKESGEELNFNSGGMFELRANQNGKELKLNKAATVDFVATEKLQNMNYYAMDDSTGEWKKLKALEKQKPTAPGGAVGKVRIRQWDSDKCSNKNLVLDTMINADELKNFPGFQGDGLTEQIGTDNAMIEIKGDAGHSYPTLVKGLQSANFGVYNCDQIYRVGNPVSINATFIDKNTNEKITKQQVLCLMDLDYNGSFSFAPNQFVCNAKGKNVLFLFTEDKSIYLLSKEEYKNMNIEKAGAYSFKMTNMTNEIKSTEDLKKFL